MFKDRAIETIDAAFTGTGTYNLGGAATNSQALDSAFGSGATFFYLVRNADWSKFEIGYGVVTSGSPDTLTRNVKRSYNGSAFGTSAVSWVLGDHPLYVYSAPVGEELALMRRTHRGTSAPTPAEAGLLWEDSTGAPTGVLLKIYDGTDWITIGTVNETANTFTPTIPTLTTRGDLLTRDASGLARLAIGATDRLLKSDGTDPGWGQLTNGMVPTNTIGIDKLANQAQSTILGRAAGAGTGAVTALTAAQATAILDAFTGDSGSGGVKGLVPAPSAGDAAAGKVLGAGGSWTTAGGWKRHTQISTGFQASVSVTDLPSSALSLMLVLRIGCATDNVNARIQFYKSGPTGITAGAESYNDGAASNVSGVFSIAQSIDNNGNYQTTVVLFLHDLQAGIYKQGWSKSAFHDNTTANIKGSHVDMAVEDTSAIIGFIITASSGNVAVAGDVFIAE